MAAIARTDPSKITYDPNPSPLSVAANYIPQTTGSYNNGPVARLAGDTSGSGGPNTDLSQYGASPYASPLLQTLRGMSAPTPISSQGSLYKPGADYVQDAYKAKDMSAAALPQYDAMRTRLNSQYTQQQSVAQDALDRQFAAAGGGPGNGAQAKQTENLAASAEAAKSNDLQSLDSQEAAARQQLQQNEEQKAFQSGEAQKGYAFQSSQTKQQMQQAADEAAASRDMGAQEFNQGQQNQFQQFIFGGQSAIAGLNTAWDEAQQEAKNNQFNKELADYQSKHSGGLFGGGGFLGLGI